MDWFEMIDIECQCPFCGKINFVSVQKIDYVMWEKNFETAQNAFRYLSADEREMIISGICPKCWDETFGGVEE